MRRRSHKLKPDTFPFLAVLLCAMGSLILVLLVFDRRAKLAARARVEQATARQAEVLAKQIEQMHAERLEKQRLSQATQEAQRAERHTQLNAEQIELLQRIHEVRGQLDDVALRLRLEDESVTDLSKKIQAERGQLADAERALGEKEKDLGRAAGQKEAASSVLTRMTADLLQAEQTLKDLKAARERERQTYSVVPYLGKHGEGRRPLYVECGPAGVIFHPDHVAVNPGLFPSEVRSEVARRFARQCELLPVSTSNAADLRPYLLLLVRPNGVHNYYELQSALRGMNVDFGYEFVDTDWALEFPDADGPPPNAWPGLAHSAPSPAGIDRPVGLAPPRIVGMPRVTQNGVSENQGGGTAARGGTAPSAMPGNPGDSPYPPRFLTGPTPGSVALSGTPSNTGRGYSGIRTGVQGFGLFGGNPVQGPGSEFAGGAVATSGDVFGPNGGNTRLPGSVPGQTGGNGSTPGLSPGMTGAGGSPGAPTGAGPYGAQTGFGIGATPSGGAQVGPGYGTGYGPHAGAGTGAAPINGGQGSPGNGTGYGPLAGAASSAAPTNGAQGSPGSGLGYGPQIGAGTSASPLDGSQGGLSAGAGYGSQAGSNTGTSPTGVAQANIATGSPRYSGIRTGGTQGAGPVAGSAMQGSAPGSVAGGSGASGDTLDPFGGSPGGQGGVPGATGHYAAVPGNVPGPDGAGGSGSGNPGAATGNATRGLRPGVVAMSAGSDPANAQPGAGNQAAMSGGSGTANAQGGAGNQVAITGNNASGQAQAPGGNSGNAGGQPVIGQTAGPATGAAPGQYGPAGAPGGTGGTGGNNAVPTQASAQAPPGSVPGSSVNQPGSGTQPAQNPVTGQTGSTAQGNPQSGYPVAQASPDQAANNTPSDPNRPRRKPNPLALPGPGGGDGGDDSLPPLAPPPEPPGAKRKPITPRPARLYGNRDWTIFLECRADRVILYPSQMEFPLTTLRGATSDTLLVRAIQQMIDRRQATVQPGQVPYRPQVLILVRPENMRAFHEAYTALDNLVVPKRRQSLQPEDDVISIVTGN